MKSEIETLTPYVNTDVKIPRKMLDALTLHEFSCAAQDIHAVSAQSVEAFLLTRFSKKLASQFKPEYLIKSPSV
jgi:hypothetical protein